MKFTVIVILAALMMSWTFYSYIQEESPEMQTEEGLDQGDLAPDFELTTLEGETVQLSDFRGSPVMLNFWATWCPPCRAEMPDMQQVYDDGDLEVLAVNLTSSESSADDVSTFVTDFGLTFPILMDEEAEISDLYEIQPVPTSYFIDENGRIQQASYGPVNEEQMRQQAEMLGD
ncbi:redoxin domain-containing protein [Alkalicoccus chagannorensis]|uniref:redoxin domain-containing protein n=1 Tax=Alkalicoccus chagannorensis TaxID=427072 RepID=UPI0003FFD038|nr:redoxin domain-containing protein [Alkalicoccus chagannorensis]